MGSLAGLWPRCPITVNGLPPGLRESSLLNPSFPGMHLDDPRIDPHRYLLAGYQQRGNA
jgi:hypothetical protein